MVTRAGANGCEQADGTARGAAPLVADERGLEELSNRSEDVTTRVIQPRMLRCLRVLVCVGNQRE